MALDEMFARIDNLVENAVKDAYKIGFREGFEAARAEKTQGEENQKSPLETANNIINEKSSSYWTPEAVASFTANFGGSPEMNINIGFWTAMIYRAGFRFVRYE